jgi:hypothetical protein
MNEKTVYQNAINEESMAKKQQTNNFKIWQLMTVRPTAKDAG